MRAIPYVLAVSVVSITAAHAATPAPSPSDFVTDAIKGDNSEIQLGKLAQDQGGSEAVKNFGRMLADDHSKAKDQASEVAQQIGVTPPSDISAEGQEQMQKLKGLKGAAFDSEFASISVEDHQKDIAKFRAEAKAKNGPASQLAAEQLPVLRKHLKMAESLEKKG
jgi:putative membrane protein